MFCVATSFKPSRDSDVGLSMIVWARRRAWVKNFWEVIRFFSILPKTSIAPSRWSSRRFANAIHNATQDNAIAKKVNQLFRSCSIIRSPAIFGACAYWTPSLCYLRATMAIYVPKRARLKVDSKSLPDSNQKRPLDITNAKALCGPPTGLPIRWRARHVVF